MGRIGLARVIDFLKMSLVDCDLDNRIMEPRLKMTRTHLTCLVICGSMLEVVSLACNGEEKCPDYLPFCTPAGCVSQCPENVYVNGTSCVEHCGENYVLGRSCVTACPQDRSLVEEQVIYVDNQYQKIRTCLATCRNNMFIYNGTCVVACPSSSKFTDNGHCIQLCPSSKPVHGNITSGQELLAVECLSACSDSVKTIFWQNNSCVAQCDMGQVVFNKRCIKECPAEAPLSIDFMQCWELTICPKGWPEQTYCSSSCLSGFSSLNNTCIEICPQFAPYSLNRTCVAECPHTYYAEINPISQKMGVQGMFCVKNCRNYVWNNTCVDECPDGLVSLDKTCVRECPDTMFVDGIDSKTAACVTRCGRFVVNKTCMSECPGHFDYILDQVCLERCPSEYPYSSDRNPYDSDQKSERLKTCVNVCDSGQRSDNVTFQCVISCPKNTKRFGLFCVAVCPPGLLIREGKENVCVDSCAKYSLNGTCVSTCPNVVVNTTCVDTCPGDLNLLYNNVCVNKCPNGTCLANDKSLCVSGCAYDSSSETFLLKCPKQTPYRQAQNSVSICVSSCGRDEVVENDICINITECRKPVLSQRRCDDSCQDGYLYLDLNARSFPESGAPQYQSDDIDNKPCVEKGVAVGMVVLLGCVCAGYAIFMLYFLYPVQPKADDKATGTVFRNRKYRARTTRVPIEADDDPLLNPETDRVPLLNTDSDDEPFIITDSVDTSVMTSGRVDNPVSVQDSGDDTIIITESRDAPVIITESRDSPVIVTERGDVPTMVTEGRDVPTMVTEGRDVPTMVTEGRDVPTMITASSDVPPVKSNNGDISLMNQDTADVSLGNSDSDNGDTELLMNTDNVNKREDIELSTL